MQKHAGKFIIIAVFLIGFGSAAVSVWYRYTQTRQVLAYYGGAAAEAITSRDTKTTLALLNTANDESDEAVPLTAGDETIEVVVEQTKEVTKTPGFHNARNAMSLDRSYDWTDTRQPAELTWRYALSIEEEDRTTTLIFSEDCKYIMLGTLGEDAKPEDAVEVPARQHAVRAAAMGEGIQKLFSEQFD